MAAKDENIDLSQFDWVQLRKDMDSGAPVETQKEKFKRKFIENPLVPVGALLTAGCLGYGLYTFRTGQKKMSQTMMRSRVVAQGFTVFAMVLGIGIGLHGK